MTDPRGHSFGLAHARVDRGDSAALASGRWRECEAYLWGADLFNAGYWWEAHEAWEEPWRAFPPDAAEARYLRGLIQVAAAALQRASGQQAGAERLLARARLTLEPVLALIAREGEAHPAVTARGRFMGLDVRRWLARAERSVEPPPMIVLE